MVDSEVVELGRHPRRGYPLSGDSIHEGAPSPRIFMQQILPIHEDSEPTEKCDKQRQGGWLCAIVLLFLLFLHESPQLEVRCSMLNCENGTFRIGNNLEGPRHSGFDAKVRALANPEHE